MVMMTSLPFAVSKPMTTAEIENFVEGSLPNGTIIENVSTGAIAVVNAGMPQYLPYAEGIIPDVSDFVTQEEISNLMEKPTATGSVGQVLTRANGSVPYEWANGPTVDTSSLMEKPTATGSVGQVLTRANGSVPYEWADAPSGGSVISGVKTARFVIGTSTAGWTAADCDYLCNGTADQTEINAAINALPATGGEVVILDGTYNITAKIDVTKDNVSIRGNGNATILKRMFNSSTTEGVITLTGRSGCKIANLQIEGNKTSYTNSNNHGICLDASRSNNAITGNTCNNNDNGIYLISSSNNNTITGNTCNNNRSNGIQLNTSSNNNTITSNTCNNNDNGIQLQMTSNNTVTGNTCDNNKSNGIYLRTSSSNNTITGNTCNRGTGLAADYTAHQHTIQLSGTDNSYNLIAMNNCMGKAVTNGGGTGNTLVYNKFDAA